MTSKQTTSNKPKDPRRGLKFSAASATFLAVVGHIFLGFEQSVAQLLVALGAGYTAALVFESIDAAMEDRAPRWRGRGARGLFEFLLSAHMSAVTISFLVYANDRLWMMAFVVTAAIGSKHIFRLHDGKRFRHFMNPSNFGIAITLLLFHWTTVIPYEFTEGFQGWGRPGQWVLPLTIVVLGSRLNHLFTKRLPLIAAWLGTFMLQALVRGVVTDAPLFSGFVPMTGVAFVLFSFYMVTDPMTSPASLRGQIIFGCSLGLVYAALMSQH
ncbi:MAG TPA: enediyne biosynthesis protein UnbU, partial [Sorangium sp.]|nr:enediyne biosynthesis protein UnbU [Sorangium sp.]